MIDPKTLDEMARKLAASLPSNISGFQKDVEKNLRAGLEGLIQKLDLVTREEYEVQVSLLERSRQQLQELEDRISTLEKTQGLPQATQKAK